MHYSHRHFSISALIRLKNSNGGLRFLHSFSKKTLLQLSVAALFIRIKSTESKMLHSKITNFQRIFLVLEKRIYISHFLFYLVIKCIILESQNDFSFSHFIRIF